MSDPDTWCPFWGDITPGAYVHMDCGVVLEHRDSSAVGPALANMNAKLPLVCLCDCRTCKRAWFADGQPIQQDPGGHIERRA